MNYCIAHTIAWNTEEPTVDEFAEAIIPSVPNDEFKNTNLLGSDSCVVVSSGLTAWENSVAELSMDRWPDVVFSIDFVWEYDDHQVTYMMNGRGYRAAYIKPDFSMKAFNDIVRSLKEIKEYQS